MSSERGSSTNFIGESTVSLRPKETKISVGDECDALTFTSKMEGDKILLVTRDGVVEMERESQD